MHIHIGVGADPYFNLAGPRLMLLDPALNDPALRQTRFVLIHGGWPFEGETGVMLMKPYVYADFSAQMFLRSIHAQAETLRAQVTRVEVIDYTKEDFTRRGDRYDFIFDVPGNHPFSACTRSGI